MSLFTTTMIDCSDCQAVFDFQAAGSVNADRRPELRDAILDSSFQTVVCPSCGASTRLEPLFNYLDVASALWLAAYPPGAMGNLVAIETEVKALFDESYGTNATPAAQGVGDILNARLTFGWPATREKVLLRQNDLEDVSIEMLKLDLLRRLPEAPLRPGVELRVMDVSQEMLSFVWTVADTEEILQEFEASRQLLQEIEANAEGWAAVRTDLTAGMFVDIQKLYLDLGQDAA
jgi:hypothetical protein